MNFLINKNFFVCYQEDECSLKVFESTIRGFDGFNSIYDYNERLNQLKNLPITMKKIYVNICAIDFFMEVIYNYKEHFENLPPLLEELNITVYIPKHYNDHMILETRKKFDLFMCQIEKIPFGCNVSIKYLTT